MIVFLSSRACTYANFLFPFSLSLSFACEARALAPPQSLYLLSSVICKCEEGREMETSITTRVFFFFMLLFSSLLPLLCGCDNEVDLKSSSRLCPSLSLTHI